MISEQRIRDLIALGNENRNLDYKRGFSWTEANNDEKCEVVKDVLAFANARDGGLILIGVDENSGVLEGLTEEQWLSFEQTRFNDFIDRFSEPRHTSFVYRKILDEKRLIVIEIPEFVDLPILCTSSVQNSRKPTQLILRQGGLYKRTDKATSVLIEDSSDMRELINRAVLRRQDELMLAIKQIVEPRTQSAVPIETGFTKEIQEGEVYFDEISRDKLAEAPHWELTIYPTVYSKDRIASIGEIRERVSGAAVSLRGWTFPIAGKISQATWSNFNQGSESFLDSSIHAAEATRAYKSGLFMWRSGLWEHSQGRFEGKPVVSFISAIYSATEWMLFAQRYYESMIAIDESLQIEVGLVHSVNHELITADPRVSLDQFYRCNVETIEFKEMIQMADLRADPLPPARRIVRRLFELFNWNNPREEMLSGWQQQLISRQF